MCSAAILSTLVLPLFFSFTRHRGQALPPDNDIDIDSFNEDDYKNALYQVLSGPQKEACVENSRDDIPELICKIYKTLKDSPVTILPFIESCKRNAN